MTGIGKETIGVVGAGAMGSGIAQVAAIAGHQVLLFDSRPEALISAERDLSHRIKRLQEKGKIDSAEAILSAVSYENDLSALKPCEMVIEAIIEDADAKRSLFHDLEKVVDDQCLVATNTSSLSVTGLAAACQKPERFIGLHFFNPAPLMVLVEIVPALQTCPDFVPKMICKMQQWGKVPVVAKDTPGFIVNRVARPFYGEALRILDEGIADMATIDWAMTELGGFRMGPFTLMDYIGHDVNYVVTETVFRSFFFDPKYKPSFSQKRLLEAGWLGRKSGRGFYDYRDGAVQPKHDPDEKKGRKIAERIIAMLINEAVEALHQGIATYEDLELAMTKGVNYPEGLLSWCERWGAVKVLALLDTLFDTYHEERYRASVLLRQMAKN